MTARNLMAIGLALAIILCVQISRAVEPAGKRDNPTKTNFTHVVISSTPYYTMSPAQGYPPEGTLAKGTKVAVVRDAGSYALVRSETGVRAYVSAGAIKPVGGSANEDNDGAATTGDALASVAAGNNRFATDLYGHLRKTTSENLFCSPFSIRIALAMTYAGAAGDTANQMAKVLHFGLPESELNAAMAELQKTLMGKAGKGYQFRVANRLWGAKGYEFLPQFLDATRQFYGAELQTEDFANQPEPSRQAINAWVEKQTEDKIKDLLPPGVIDAMTRLVLTNAIYFKGDWQTKFEKAATQDAKFTLLSNEQSTVPMMHQIDRFGYRATDDLQILEMPYAEGALSMIVLLPKQASGLPALEEKFSQQNLQQWTKGLRRQKVVVFLPRFKMTSQFGLKDTLQAMGMSLAFDEGKADFSRMTSKEGLFISAVVHKAFVDVNEEGTEAAAATGIVMVPTSAEFPIEEPPVFRADHPFLFLIRESKTGSIVFLGRVLDPKAAE